MTDKVQQHIGLFGGLLSSIYFFILTLNIEFHWFNLETIGALETVLLSAVPFALLVFGVYKNSYIITPKAKEQEDVLKKRGLK